jgi:N-carbamoylputrescine amidase
VRVALVVPELTSDVSINLSGIRAALLRAAEAGARLVVFPEATLTGLVNNGDPRHDFPLGQTIPGPATDDIGALCVRLNVWTALGLIEKDRGELYDSAALVDPSGTIRLKYRRIQPQWHGRAADPSIYRQGSFVGRAETPFGVVSLPTPRKESVR